LKRRLDGAGERGNVAVAASPVEEGFRRSRYFFGGGRFGSAATAIERERERGEFDSSRPLC